MWDRKENFTGGYSHLQQHLFIHAKETISVLTVYQTGEKLNFGRHTIITFYFSAIIINGYIFFYSNSSFTRNSNPYR